MPASRKPGSSVVQLESDATPCISSQPDGDQQQAGAEQVAHLDARGELPRDGATKNEISVIGRKRRPASSGEKPRMFCT